MKTTGRIALVSAVATVALIVTTSSAPARGNLATSDVRAITLEVGTAASEMAFKPNEISLETGKAYVLKLVNNGKVKHEFASDEFMHHIYIRKAEAGAGNGVEIKGAIREIELKNHGNHADLYFVPIEPGTYEFHCDLPGHREAGMEGKFIVE
jgi:uncharacterized cupredoxin-like copper-binding protein